MANEVITLAQELIRCGDGNDSNKAVQQLLVNSLANCKGNTTVVQAGGTQHSLTLLGSQGPLLAYVGHSDVVSTGDESDWTHPPFAGVIDDGYLYGRGSVDMRAANAAFSLALNEVWSEISDSIRIALIISGDEETKASGTPALLAHLQNQGLQAAVCLVGEPSAKDVTGDRVRIGRRGSITGIFNFKGEQGHTAYRCAETNVLHSAIAAAEQLCAQSWPKDPDPWPEVNFHVTNFSSGTGESGVVPPSASFRINVRFGPSLSRERVIEICEQLVDQSVKAESVNWSTQWREGCKPFFTETGVWTEIVSETVEAITGRKVQQAVDGGTSDGRFVADLGIPTIEVGTPAIGLHAVNERIKIDDLNRLVEIYAAILRKAATSSKQLG